MLYLRNANKGDAQILGVCPVVRHNRGNSLHVCLLATPIHLEFTACENHVSCSRCMSDVSRQANNGLNTVVVCRILVSVEEVALQQFRIVGALSCTLLTSGLARYYLGRCADKKTRRKPIPAGGGSVQETGWHLNLDPESPHPLDARKVYLS